MRKTVRSTVVALFLCGLAGLASAQQRRMVGTITDTEGTPLENVDVQASSPQSARFALKSQTNDKGVFTLMFVQAEISELVLKVSKDGYVPAEFTAEIPSGGNLRMNFKIESEASLASRVEAVERAKAPDAVTPHNQAVDAAAAGDWEGAAKHFEEALAIKDDVAVTHAGLATAAWNLKEYERAEKHARRALDLDPTQDDTRRLLAVALEEQGKTSEAESVRTVLAAGDPHLLAELAFNRGAELANEKKDDLALAAFEEAVAADPSLADAHYAVGITAFRLGSTDRALAALTTYLELAPEGKNAKLARQLLSAIPAK